MNVHFDINNKAVVVLVNKLEKLRKTALPNAIRNTLNSAAFDVKQNTMPVSAEKNFEKRKPNFFKANSKVFMAQGRDVKGLKAIVGFTSSNAQYNNFAVEELEQQEHSGIINKRTFVPLDFARSGGSHSSQILPSNRLKVIKNIKEASKATGVNRKQQFIRAAIAAGKKGFVIGNLGKQTLFRIDNIKKVDGRTVITRTPIYSFKQGRSVRIRKATHFMRSASYQSAKKINTFFIKEAKKQIEFHFK